MARLPWRRTTKAAPAPAGATVALTTEQIVALVDGGQHGSTRQQLTARPMPTPPEWFTRPFSPGSPLNPSPINDPRPDTGRPEPRLWQFPQSWNLQISADKLVPWNVLREAADMPIFRQCIEARKRALCNLDWTIKPTAEAVEGAMRAGDLSKADAQDALRSRLEPEIARLTEWWSTPDAKEGHEFTDWLGLAMEEQLVLDATAIYPRYTFGGDLFSLEQVDGSTIKPLLDERGGRPLPPYPAYQQILYGFPRGEWVADLDDEDNVADPFSADELIYRRRVVRMKSPYGFSPTERALIDGRLYLARLQWMLAEYSDGMLPKGWLLNDGSSDWDPEQLDEYERLLHDSMAGKIAERYRQRLLPPGITPQEAAGVAEQYKPDYDIHLITLVASHFNVTTSEMGFAPPGMGLGGSGWSDGQEAVNWRTGTLPDAKWWASFITRASRIHLAMPGQLEFGFLGLDDEDETTTDTLWDTRIRSARATVNEDRDRLGLPRFDIPEADRPMVITNRGVIPLEGAIAAAEAGQQATQNLADGGLPPEQQGEQVEEGDQGDQGDDGQQVAKAELATFRRWTRKRQPAGRRFEFTADKSVLLKLAPDLADDDRVVFKAGDAGPKARGGPHDWPGWDKDLELAAVYAPRIRAALTAVDLRPVGEAWAAARGLTKRAEPVDDGDSMSWLGQYELAQQYETALKPVLKDLWAEAALIGRRSAEALLEQTAVFWDDWEPGHPAAAALLLDGVQSVQQLLDNWGLTEIQSIASTRVGEFAELLSKSLREGWSTAELAKVIDDMAKDADTAEMIAITETSRAQSQAALDYYTETGVDRVSWLVSSANVCPICLANEAQGAIRVGQMFQSGDPGPPAHPRCRCATLPVLS